MPDTNLVIPAAGWKPRDYQRGFWRYMENGGKRYVGCWHRRAGKDENCLHWACVSALQKPATYWHMLPQANQARRAIWEAINPHTGKRRIDEAFPPSIRASTREAEMMIKLVNGATWQVVGSDNYSSVIGSPPYGVVFSEYSISNPAAWDFIRPILAENGGWAAFIYTPRGRNHGWKLLQLARETKGWFSEVLGADVTKALPMEILESERKELCRMHGSDAGNALFEQEYLCSFQAAILGAYYGALMKQAEDEKRISNVAYDPSVRVITSWDLGIGDSTAIWFAQRVGREVRIIDYYEASGAGLEHYVRMLEQRGYLYEFHILPHDVRQSELGTGTTRLETLYKLGITNIRVMPAIKIDDGINAARHLIPMCWFDAMKCERGIEALRHYQREWDEQLLTFRQRPLHDWSSHGSDAFRYLAQGIVQGLDSPVLHAAPILPDYNPFA